MTWHSTLLCSYFSSFSFCNLQCVTWFYLSYLVWMLNNTCMYARQHSSYGVTTFLDLCVLLGEYIFRIHHWHRCIQHTAKQSTVNLLMSNNWTWYILNKWIDLMLFFSIVFPLVCRLVRTVDSNDEKSMVVSRELNKCYKLNVYLMNVKFQETGQVLRTNMNILQCCAPSNVIWIHAVSFDSNHQWILSPDLL